MGSDPPDLGKGLFGYRKSAVNQIIADRDIMLRQAEGRVRAAEAKVAELETEVSSFREQNARMDEQLDRLRSQLDVVLRRTETGHAAQGLEEEAPPGASQADYEEGSGANRGYPPGAYAYGGEPDRYQSAPPPPPVTEPRKDDVTSRFLTEELAGILAAAEESAARIVERARASTQRQIMESNRLWREVQAEVARFASWRDQVEPAIRQVQSKVDSVRGLVDDVPERIRQALAPMADAISSIDADMAELASALTPPLLLTPSGFEDEGQSWLSRAAQMNPDLEAPEELSPGQGARTYEGGDTPGPLGAEAG